MISFSKDYGGMIASKAGTQFNPTWDIVISRIRPEDRFLYGGVVFQNFTHESIAMHVSSWHPRWIDRAILWCTFDYPFRQLGVQRIFGGIKTDNARALQFDLNLGFRIVTTIPNVYREGVGKYIVCMEKSECRFLRMRRPRFELDDTL